MKPIKIMPDFCSSGIWDLKTGVMRDEEDFKLPRPLLKRLHSWINVTYEKCHTKRYAAKKDPRVWGRMNLEGLAIACDIKELHPDWIIYFSFEGPRSRVDVEIQEISYFTGEGDNSVHHLIKYGKASTFRSGGKIEPSKGHNMVPGRSSMYKSHQGHQ